MTKFKHKQLKSKVAIITVDKLSKSRLITTATDKKVLSDLVEMLNKLLGFIYCFSKKIENFLML